MQLRRRLRGSRSRKAGTGLAARQRGLRDGHGDRSEDVSPERRASRFGYRWVRR